jgi:hypothetical protein
MPPTNLVEESDPYLTIRGGSASEEADPYLTIRGDKPKEIDPYLTVGVTQNARREPPELKAATPMTSEDIALGEARRDVQKRGEEIAYEESTRKNLRNQGFPEPMISALLMPGGESLDRAISLAAPIAGGIAGTAAIPVAGPTAPYIGGGGAAALANTWAQLREHARSGATTPIDFKKGRFLGEVFMGAVIPAPARTLAPGMRAAQVIETGATLGGQMGAIGAGESALRQLGDEGTIDFRELAQDTTRGAMMGATLGTTFSTASQIYKNLKLKNAKGIEGYSPSEIGTQIALRGGGGVGGFAYGWSSNPELPFDKRLENALLWASASGGLAPTVIFKAIKKVRGSGPAKTKVFADWQDAMNREYGPGTVPEVSDKLAYPEWKAAMAERHGDNPYLDEVWDIIQLRKSEVEARTPAGKAKLAEEAATANKAKLAEQEALAAEKAAAEEALAAEQARAEEVLAARQAVTAEIPGVPRRPIIDESEADLARRKINEDFGNNAGESAAVFEATARAAEEQAAARAAEELAAARAAEELAATTAKNLEPAANIARNIEGELPVKSAEEAAEVIGAAEARESARLAREAALDAGGFTAAKERARIQAERNAELTPRSQFAFQGAAAAGAIADEANAKPDDNEMLRNLKWLALGMAGTKSPRVLKAIAQLSAKKTLSKQEAVKMWEYANGLLEQAKLRGTDMFNTGKGQMEGIISGLESVPVFKQLKDVVKYIGNYADAVPVIPKGLRMGTPLGRETAVEALKNHTVAEGTAYKKAFPDDQSFYVGNIVNFTNPSFQEAALLRYGRYLTESEIKLIHIYSALGSGNATPVVDTALGFKVFDEMMRTGKGTGYGERPKQAYASSAPGKVRKPIYIDSKTGLDTFEAKGNEPKIHPLHKSKISKTFVVSGAENFNRILEHFDDDLDAVVTWLGSRHSFDDIKKVIGPEAAKGLKTHEYLNKSGESFGVFALGNNPKQGSYILNRWQELGTITKDMWVARTMSRYFREKNTGIPWTTSEAGNYKRGILEEAWSRAAKELNLKPAELQELMWAAERRIYERMGQKKGASYTSGWADSAVAKLEPFTTDTPLIGRSGVMAANANAPTDFPGAVSQMSSPEQARFRKLAGDLAPNAVIYDAAGEWNGEAANSLILAFEKIRSPSKLRELAASMGSARDQRSVPLWYVNAVGDDAIHQIQWGREVSLADARQSMIDVGLNDRSFIQTPDGVKALLLDPGQKNLAAIQKLKTHESSPSVDSRPATVEFLGGSLREEGRQAFRQVLGLAESRRSATKLGTAGAREVGADSLSTPESRARAISESRFHVTSERGGYFEGAIARAARDHPMGAAVEVKSLEFYRDPSNTLYLSTDGLAGVAVKPDGDLVSVFKHPTSTARVGEILADASKIATKLDAFDVDGFLPILYSKHGFRPVARVPFNDAFAPPGWNVDTMGRPDVVLMVKDVGNRLGLPDATNYNDLIRNRVPVVDYNRAMQLQQGALDDLRALNRKPSKSGTSTLWSPKSIEGFGQREVLARIALHGGGGAGGFAAGWSANSELPPDKRLEKALMWAAAAGGLGPAAIFKAIKLAQGSGPAKIPRAKLDPQTASLDDLRNIFIHEAEKSPSLLARINRTTEVLQDRNQPLTEVEQAILGSRPQGLTLGDRASLIAGAAGKAEAALIPLIELRKTLTGVDDLDVSTFLFLRRTMDRLETNKRNAAAYAVQQANYVFGPKPVAPTPRDVGTFTEAIVRQKMALLQAKLGNNNLLALDALGAEFQKLSDANMQTLVDAGRLSKADLATIKADNEFYAPFKVMKYMSAVEGVKGTGRAIDTTVSVIKAIKGIKDEDIQLGDIMLAMGENTLKTHVLAEKNRVMLALEDLANADPTGKYIQRVAPHKSPPPGFVGVNYMKDGKKLELAVLEPVARAVKGLNEQQLGVVGAALKNSAAVFRLGTVGANIGFQLVNSVKDQKRFAELSKYGFTSIADLYRYPLDFSQAAIASWKSNILGKKNQLALDFMKSGSAGSTIAETLAPSAFRPQASVFNPLSMGIEWSARIGKAIEETTKIMGYKRGARLEGLEKLTGTDRQKALDRIAYEVRNYAGSPDFNKHGTIGLQMNILFMFANARMQGVAADMRRLSGRTGGREAVSAMGRLAVGTGLPTLALWYYNQRGDNLTDYEALSKREKTNNWMIPQYGADGKPLYFINEEGYRKREYIKLPKTDILAQTALITEGMLNFAKDQDPKAAMEAGQQFLENLSPINISGRNYQERVESIISGLNPILKTPLEFSTGRDTFRHQSIVPRRLEGAPANLQFKDSTNEIFKNVANQMSPDASPLQLQRAVENMTGGLATQFMRPEQPGRSLLVSSPFFGRFFGSPAETREKEWEIVNQWGTKATGESVVRGNAIRAIVNNMGKQPEAQTGRDLFTLIERDPKSIPAIISALQDKSAGTTAIDKALKGLPTKARAGAMMEMLGTFKTSEEKSEYLESMVKRGVLTKDVMVEMRNSMKKP